MEEYLEGFVEFVKTNTGIISTATAMLVIDAFEQKLDIDEFRSCVDVRLRTKPTGIFLCDFEKEQVDAITSTIRSHGGIYEIHLSPTGDLEDNEIYAAFPSPVYAYQCLRQVMTP